MKTKLTLAALAVLAAAAGCRSNAPPAAYANPVEACEHKATETERNRCMDDIVEDVALSVKRESQRKPPQ